MRCVVVALMQLAREYAPAPAAGGDVQPAVVGAGGEHQGGLEISGCAKVRCREEEEQRAEKAGRRKRQRQQQLWRGSMQLVEGPPGSPVVTLSVGGQVTEDATKAALAEVLHLRVMNQPISTDEAKNLNDYSSPLGFLDSIRREHARMNPDKDDPDAVEPEMPESFTAVGVWDSLYDAVCTLRVEPEPLESQLSAFG